MKLAALTISAGIALGLLASQAEADPIFDPGPNALHHYDASAGWSRFSRYANDRIFNISFEQQQDLARGGRSFQVRGDIYQISTRQIDRTIHNRYGTLRAGTTWHFDGVGALSPWSIYISDVDGRIGEDMTIDWSLRWFEGSTQYVSVTKTTDLRGYTVRKWVSAPGTAALLSMGLLGLWRARRDQAN